MLICIFNKRDDNDPYSVHGQLCLMLAGDTLPVQLDARFSESAGEAADETDPMAQCSFTSCLVPVTAENGIVSPRVF